MSTTPYYQISAIYNTGEVSEGNGYGSKMKAIVQLLLPLDSSLAVKTVFEDTDDKYDVFLSVFGSNQGFRIYNRSDEINADAGFYDSSGNYNVISNSSTNNNVLNINRQVCCITWGIGQCLRHIAFSCSSGPTCIVDWYGRFTCSGRSDTLIIQGTSGRYVSPFRTAPIISYPFPYIVDDDISSRMSASNYSLESPYLLSGYNAAFCPMWYQGYSTNHGYLNIKWDGAHSLYQLYAGKNLVSITPGQNISVNGQSIMSVGNVIYAV